MNKVARLLLIVLVLTIGVSDAFGQEKFEKESRLNSKNVPSKAQAFIYELGKGFRVKWYEEQGLESKSIEAKFKLAKQRHSVEFDTAGNIQDLEIEIKWQGIQKQVQDSIQSHLDRMCDRHTTSKIQIQYIGMASDILNYIQSKKRAENLAINFELIVKCAYDNQRDVFELLFDEKGKLVAKSKIIFQNSSNLEY